MPSQFILSYIRCPLAKVVCTVCENRPLMDQVSIIKIMVYWQFPLMYPSLWHQGAASITCAGAIESTFSILSEICWVALCEKMHIHSEGSMLYLPK